MESKKKVVNNNIPLNPKGWATWPKYVPARNRRRLNASSKRNVVFGTTFGLFYDAHVCTSTSWPTFTPPQPIPGVISAFSKHKREKETWWRGGGAVGVTMSNASYTRASSFRQRSSMFEKDSSPRYTTSFRLKSVGVSHCACVILMS